MQLSDFDYSLPQSAIALHPPKVRGGSRMLVLQRDSGNFEDSVYSKLPNFLKAGDVLVVNNTRVIPARLNALNAEGSPRELLLLEQHGNTKDHHSSMVMYRGKLHAGQSLTIADSQILVEEVYDNGTAKISSTTDLWELAQERGEVPLPPYMHRREEAEDRERYQTEFARANGSVAAPTASLNLTSALLAELKQKGIQVVELTLHVGLGTFMPIRVDDVTKHKMHQEYFEIPAETVQIIRQAKQQGRRVVAVGTTVTRTLEFAANDILLDASKDLSGEADIFIYPGYAFKVVDCLLTNFHAPHSTVLMMAAAFAGWQNLKRAYEHALADDYKFLSYGDSMLIV